MPQKIQNPRVAEALQRAFNLVGRVRPALDEVVVPVVTVGTLGAGSPPPVVQAATARFSQSAVPAEYTTWRLETPPNVLAWVKSVTVAAAAAVTMHVAFPGNSAALSAPANTANEAITDNRINAAAPAGSLSYGTDANALPAAAFRYLLPNSTVVIRPNRWLIGGSDEYEFIEFQLTSVNVGVNAVAVEWEEYRVL